MPSAYVLICKLPFFLSVFAMNKIHTVFAEGECAIIMPLQALLRKSVASGVD